MKLEHLTMTDGYVGGMGKSWKTLTETTIEEAITGAMEMNNMTREQVIATLESGKALKWGKSPNFYYDHSYALIGRRRDAPAVEMQACDCGHTIPRALVMNASMGTSCPDCYDRMS